MRIQFLGATHTVTGSKYLIKNNEKMGLVDCGLFQGLKELRLRNWNPLPLNPAELDFVVLTHAHIDHSGYIPLLVRNGFQGKIYCSEPTRDLCEILLPDSGHLQEEAANYAARKGFSKHHPPMPLYTRAEAEASLAFFHPVGFKQDIALDKELHFRLHYAGHILGASLVRMESQGVSLLFSGDLGRLEDPLMYPPDSPPASDYYVVESTYGDRLHEAGSPEEQLSQIINKTVRQGGTILLPAFAVGRTQAILYDIYRLKEENKIPDIPVFVDSPMATDATKLFFKYHDCHRLSKAASERVCRTARYINSVEESMELDHKKMPMIIISASGMATGGRVLHHIRCFAPDERNAIVFCGFQASGTRGARMVSGEQSIKMFGQMISVRASIYSLDNTSAHADSSEIMHWLSAIKDPPRKIFITHGENTASEALKKNIEGQYGWKVTIPSYLDEEELV